MKIAILAPPFQPVPPLTDGGTERVIAYLCDEWKTLGHEVTLFAPSDSKIAVTLHSPGPSIFSQQDPPPSLPAAYEAISLSQLRQQIENFDIIHCHTEFAHLAALEPFHSRLVTTLHWRVDEEDRQLIYRHFDRAHLIAISENQQKQRSGGRATVIPHGLPEDLYQADLIGGPKLAFIGRMTDQKRPDLAIKVAKLADREIILAGKKDIGNPQYFDSYVAPHLSPRAEWLGAINDDQKEQLLQHSAALLFPIDWDEPFGLVMIEAMACGCPVIAWNRGSVPEVIEDGVTGFIVSSTSEAVEAVHRLPTLNRARIRARFEARFTARRMAQDHLSYFNSILKSSQ